MIDMVVSIGECFCCWYNVEGVMEYWLEDVSLMEICKVVGVEDFLWIFFYGNIRFLCIIKLIC